jgi:tetratricopeptide (TPR) repeat protein
MLVLGEWDKAIDHFAHAMRLSPFDPLLFMMQGDTATGHFYTGRYDEAAVWAAKSIGANPKNPAAWRTAAASNALLGRQEQAQNALAHLRQLDPAKTCKPKVRTSKPAAREPRQNERWFAKGWSAGVIGVPSSDPLPTDSDQMLEDWRAAFDFG